MENQAAPYNKMAYICGLNNGGYFKILTDVIFISFRVGVVSRPFFVYTDYLCIFVLCYHFTL